MGYAQQLTDIVNREFPRRVIRLRELHSLSQQQLALKAGMNVSTVNQIERGEKSGINLQTVLKLAFFFEVSLDYLTGMEEAGLARSAVHSGEQCPECTAPAHSIPACIFELHHAGRSDFYIAARFGMTLLEVRVMLDEEHRLRRERKVQKA